MTNNVVTMKEKGKELVTYESFNEQLDQAHESKQWTKYIVNYLWKTFSVRNEDANVVIVTSMKEANANPDKIYLVIQESKINYIRNKYKTVKKYGKQSHIISESNFVSAVKKHGEGELLKGTQIGNCVAPGDTCVELCAVGDTGLKTGWVRCRHGVGRVSPRLFLTETYS